MSDLLGVYNWDLGAAVTSLFPTIKQIDNARLPNTSRMSSLFFYLFFFLLFSFVFLLYIFSSFLFYLLVNIGTFWKAHEDRRAFVQFAKRRGFDPLVAANWHNARSDVTLSKVAPLSLPLSSLLTTHLPLVSLPYPSRIALSYLFRVPLASRISLVSLSHPFCERAFAPWTLSPPPSPLLPLLSSLFLLMNDPAGWGACEDLWELQEGLRCSLPWTPNEKKRNLK